MDFHQLATSATTAFADQLRRQQTETALAQLQALRDALDAAARAIVATAACAEQDDCGALAALLAARLEAELAAVRAEADAALASQREQIEFERAANTELKAALDRGRHELEGLAAALQDAREDASAARERVSALTTEITGREEAQRAAAALADAQLTEARQAIAALTGEVRAERARAEAAEQAAERATAAAAGAERELRAETDRARVELEDLRREAGRLAADLLAERESASAAADRAAQSAASAAAREEGYHARIAQLESALGGSRDDTARATTDLQAMTERAITAERDLARSVEAHADVEGALRQVRVEAAESARAHQVLVARLDESERACEERGHEAAALRNELEQAAGHAADLENRLAEALAAGRDRDALAASLANRTARVHELEAAAAAQSAEVLQLAARLKDASQTETQLVEDLAARELAFAAEREAAHTAREALRELEARQAEVAARVQALEEDLACAGQTARTEREALTAQLEMALARTHALEAELASAREQHSRLQSRLDEAAHVEAALRVELVGAGAGYDASAARVRTLEREMAAAAQAARAERESLGRQLDAAGSRAQAVEAELAAERDARMQLESRLGEAARLEAGLRAELAGGRAGRPTDDAAVDALRAQVDRLAALLDISARGADELASTATTADLLDGMVKRLALQFTRVALFRVKGDRLEIEQQIGVDEALTGASRILPLAAESLPARAIRDRQIATLSGDDVASQSGLSLGGAPAWAIALPLVLHGTPIAVVYADDDGDAREGGMTAAHHQAGVAFAQVLTGQVLALLVRHTHELKTLAELRQYAATLLQESREMYAADVAAGRSGDVLRSRLRENIDCASQLYTYRAAMEGTAAASLFDEQIAEAAAGDSDFARDLAGIANTLLASAESLIA